MPILLYHCWVGISLGCLFYYFIAGWVFHWGTYHSISLLHGYFIGVPIYYFIAGGFHWDAYSIISLLGGYFIGVLIILLFLCCGISLGFLFYIIFGVYLI